MIEETKAKLKVCPIMSSTGMPNHYSSAAPFISHCRGSNCMLWIPEVLGEGIGKTTRGKCGMSNE